MLHRLDLQCLLHSQMYRPAFEEILRQILENLMDYFSMLHQDFEGSIYRVNSIDSVVIQIRLFRQLGPPKVTDIAYQW